MEAQVEEKGEVTVVRLEGRVDAHSSPQLEKQLQSIIDSGHFKFVLNFEKVDYLSSAGMRLMLAISKKLKTLAGKLVTCGMNDEVLDVIKMAGFNQVIEIYQTEEEAFAHL